MHHYTVQSPVLLLAFNRPDTAQRIFDAVKAVKPARLYIAADGPREGNEKDKALCEETRKIYDQVDWECTVHKLFREKNKGCKTAVGEAITWFFEHEEEGIILEDDCLPAEDFFYFCDQMLERYRYDTRIHNITGTNLQRGLKRGNASYYFSQYSNIWGWASWRRVWKKYDAELSRYDAAEVGVKLKEIFSDPFLAADWLYTFNELKAGKIDTWDYQLNFITFFENALCITPNVNLISNIGFRSDATHTPDPNHHNANLPTERIGTLTHPVYFLPDKEADHFFLNKEFGLEQRWKRHNKKTKRFKRWVKTLFNK